MQPPPPNPWCRMASPSECPSPFILRAIATGGIQEPLLGVYLQHLEHCDHCCAEIDREAVAWTGVAAGSREEQATESWKAQDTSDRGEWVGDWLETLKRATPVPAAENDGPVGQRLGPFRVVSVLGEGASAVVYEAIDEDLDRRVVLKVLRSIHGGDPGRRQMVVVEARALAAVQHQAIMPLLQLFWFQESPVLVFPRLPGETLADALAAGRVTCRAGLEVVRDVARGLGHCHSLGVFHYDVKPTNIWLHRLSDGQDKPLLFDFGLSGGVGDSVGTPGYSDPTAVASRRPESRDLFSLGVVLHECLAECADVPAGARDLVRRLTVAPVDQRPHAAAVAADIDRILGAQGRSRWMVAAAAGLAALAVTAAVAVPRFLVQPAGAGRTVENGPLAPESILPARGTPARVSADAAIQVFVGEGPSLQVVDVATGETRAKVALRFHPDRLELNADASRAAVASDGGEVAIVDIPTGQVEVTHTFAEGVSSIGWSGWNRDVLVVLSDREVVGFFEGKGARLAGETLPQWSYAPLRNRVARMATLHGAEAIVSLDDRGVITIWSVGNLTPDMEVSLPPVADPEAAEVQIGWKGPGVCYLVRGTSVVSYATHHAIVTDMVSAPPTAIVWSNDSEYAVLTEGEGGSSRIVLGDTQRPDWSRECDTGGERIERIEILKDHRHLAAITAAGEARIYRLRP